MKNQRINTEKINLIEEGKRKGIDKIIRQNAILNNTKNTIILFKVQKKYRKHKSQSFKVPIIKQCCYQNVLYVVLKNQDLSKNKKQLHY